MCDNTTAVNVTNHVGTSHSDSCKSMTKEIWEWSIDRKIWVNAVYIPGKQKLQILNTEETKENVSGALTKHLLYVLLRGKTSNLI